MQGVITNVTPYGMCVRMLENLSVGSEVFIQMMRDEAFTEALSSPVEGMIVRTIDDPEGFMDHGVQLLIENLPKRESRLVRATSTSKLSRRPASRMHTIDFRVGGPVQRRRER